MDQAVDLPLLWLLSDARNDDGLESALAAMPRGSGFVFRHYHLEPRERKDRFNRLVETAREHGHRVILAGAKGGEVRTWGADGIYGSPESLRAAPRSVGLKLATAHDAQELAVAASSGADGVFLSPVYATRSHPGAAELGPERYLALARASEIPVIALGGMTAERAATLGWPRWGAIDGLASHR